MFEFFKRVGVRKQLRASGDGASAWSGSLVAPAADAGARRPLNQPPPNLDPMPLPQVAEGNSDADWAAWEDSVAFQEGRPSEFGPATVPDTLRSTLDPVIAPDIDKDIADMVTPPEMDAFSSVTKNSA